MSREKIYKAIDVEREYQEEKPRHHMEIRERILKKRILKERILKRRILKKRILKKCRAFEEWCRQYSECELSIGLLLYTWFCLAVGVVIGWAAF